MTNSPVKLFTAETFSIEVETRYWMSGEGTYLEIASALMDEHGIDQEDGAELISPTLLAKIHSQCRDLHLLKDKSTTRKVFDAGN